MSRTLRAADPALRPHLPAAVLWDMDGTLVDTEPYWFAAQHDVVDRFGTRAWTDEHNRALIGSDLLDAGEYMRVHGGIDLEPVEIVELLLDGVVARLHRRIPWRPGARELLLDLVDAGVPCGLVTMSWRRFVDPILAELPPGTFRTVVTGDAVPPGEGKPHPTPYLLGADGCGVHPFDCVAIEDSPTGVRSALAAGCAVIGVPNVIELAPAAGLTIVAGLEDLTIDDLAAAVDPESEPPATQTITRTRRRFGPLLALVAVTLAVVGFALWPGGDDEFVVPPGAIAVDVWAPYWVLDDAVPEAALRLPAVREISPFWFDAVGVEEIRTDPNSSSALTSDFLDAAREVRGALVPSIRDAMPAGGMAAILADPATRSRHIATILEFADELDADGIDIDYEQFAFADGRSTWETTRPNWVAFVEELADALHADDRTLTISIPPVYDESVTGDRGYWVYDHGAIAEHVDAIRIMTYDYSVPDPGPIAPLSWVADSIAGVSLAVAEEHRHKLVLGVPAYGSNWVVSTDGECPASAEGRTNVTARSVLDLAARRSGVPMYDTVTGEWSFSYELAVSDATGSCTQSRQVHWVDSEGIAERVAMARDAGWGGAALWALGYESDAAWQALVNAATVTITTVPAD